MWQAPLRRLLLRLFVLPLPHSVSRWDVRNLLADSMCPLIFTSVRKVSWPTQANIVCCSLHAHCSNNTSFGVKDEIMALTAGNVYKIYIYTQRYIYTHACAHAHTHISLVLQVGKLNVLRDYISVILFLNFVKHFKVHAYSRISVGFTLIVRSKNRFLRFYLVWKACSFNNKT